MHDDITSFTSDIVVNKDSSIDVTEVIVVDVRSNILSNGLIRELPAEIDDDYGNPQFYQYKISSISLNDKKAVYRWETNAKKFVIYIGFNNQPLPAGQYTYTMQYHVDNALQAKPDADMIDWQVVHNGYAFITIEKVQATLHLPEGSVISKYGINSGLSGPNLFYDAVKTGSNQIEFNFKRPLGPDQNFEIAAQWQKGIVTISPPHGFVNTYLYVLYAAHAWLQQHDIIFPLVTIVFFYYLFTILWCWRGKFMGKIIPVSEPPFHLPPEAMRYIRVMQYDNKVLSTKIVDMALKRYITIEYNHGTYALKKETTDLDAMSKTEQKIYAYIFSQSSFGLDIPKGNQSKSPDDGEKRFVIWNSPLSGLFDLVKFKLMNYSAWTLKRSLETAFQSKFFKQNLLYFIPGLFLSFAALAAIALSSPNVVGGLILVTFEMLIAFLLFPVRGLYRFIKYVGITRVTWFLIKNILFVSMFLLVCVIIHFTFSSIQSSMNFAFVMLITFGNYAAYLFLCTPTIEGRAVMDKIEGFRRFLANADDQLRAGSSPLTPEQLVKYIPYAIALDIEKEWDVNFQNALRASGMDNRNFPISWYAVTGYAGTSVSNMPKFTCADLGFSITFYIYMASSTRRVGGGAGEITY